MKSCPEERSYRLFTQTLHHQPFMFPTHLHRQTFTTHTHTKKNLSPLCRWEETFDSIWHKKLFYGLYDIIQSIYTQNKCRIPISDKHSQISSARSESKSNANPDSDKSDNQGLLALKQIFTENVMKHINNYLK